uniref:NAD(P)H pyrophosphatase NUDT13, mitochondrial n=1 Tax=Oryctolagus cuniculus TaxID=9986 RepID=G1U131_RABIT|nr:NAD(P)H pyrophosphatase NUDT13, mitochondrial isoform X2 [Oryctolagus cuniculus]XP_051679736.1 NAD(P)H pyrophosphatase NUDT13, mitochondrial isoform X2 [Oryctolagus cuniculus]XP_051679737.1 NAD(P)H pyrophosphatase NUDT13, mitochondrial isoform X2 [Oryctolagus cuniculus]XP_051679738.1 NAD(P)H pyrophosphatase NUDT13, mitochondrial isoform X2 [Oryctolagus cuniculus]XP_051679739.1 NAD(P)H pyrophosphatase NUDT13, mitochondrial isoform X2 [Oryctolagus cuniculus]XP_051679740.1 NAD(P)H pyrophosphat
MFLYCGAAWRSKSGYFRLLSTYVTKTRYLFELKEDDNACKKAQQTGAFYLFHHLAPLLQISERHYMAPRVSLLELEKLLEKCGQDTQRIEDSVLIGCSEQQEAWFALDLGLNSSSAVSASLQKSQMETELQGSFIELRKALFQMDVKDVPLLFTAQALLSWHDAHQFCSRSGQPTRKNMAGSKRVCPSSNIIYYPQMAPVVITLVSDGTRCLLARQSSFPKGMYSALAGFCDIGESVEEAVRREVAEEVGLEVESLQYSTSQHWPFPNCSLMIACHATVKPGQTEIQLNLKELEAAAWFSHDEVAAALRRKNPYIRQQNETFPFWVPPKLAVAHQLIKEWVEKQACSPPA